MLIPIAHRSLSLTESAFLKHYKRGRFKFDSGVAFTGSELPGPGFNFAACLGPCPPLAEVERMGREFFSDATAGWGILVEGGAGHPIEAELTAAGWAVAEDEPAFVLSPLSLGGRGNLALSLSPAEGEGSKAKIRPVLNEQDRATFQHLCTVAFNAPPELADLIMPSLAFALDPQMGWFLADVAGESVACGGYYRSEQTAVICCLATLPEHRGQGLGAAVTNHCLAHAADRGCVHASLRSGPLSVPLYERCGFRYVCQHRTYAGPQS